MFGYIRINKFDLTFREFEHYKSMYCGICKYIKRNYGEIPRLSLNYDITFLQLVLTSIYNPKGRVFYERCIVNPFKEKKHSQNSISGYSCAMNIILAYYKLEDDVRDNKDLKSKLARLALKKSFEMAENLYNDKALAIKKYLGDLAELEKDQKSDLDKLSNSFGNVMSQIFDYIPNESGFARYKEREDISLRLKKIGFNLGKYIYILDAFEDLEEDIIRGRFNPFKSNLDLRSREDFKKFKSLDDWKKLTEYIDRKISFILGLVVEDFDDLDIKYNKGIIDNIIYSGVYYRYKRILYSPGENMSGGGFKNGI